MKTQDKVVAFVNLWFPDRNFGFASRLLSDGSLEKYFVHAGNVISGRLEKGAWVRFTPLSNAKGLIGRDIEVFVGREEMERHDAAVALAKSAKAQPVAKPLALTGNTEVQS